MKKILIIEDDPTIIEGLITAFEFHGFELFIGMNGKQGIELFENKKPELIIIDIMLPDIDGFDICKKIREENKAIPIVFLTAKNQESDKLLGFELGADDYVTKPFSARELIARVKVHLKRADNSVNQQQMNQEVFIGKAQINFENYTIKKNEIICYLTPKEMKILKLLYDNPNTVVSRDRIIDEVWGNEYDPNIKTIDNFIGKLRKKIEDNPKNPIYIINVFGAGFKLNFLI